MTDAELRGKLLKVFYDRRNNGDGWVPTSDVNVAGGEPVSPQAIGNIGDQLAGAGLIEWRPLRGGEAGFVVGMAKITGIGVDVVEGHRAPPINIDLPEHPELQVSTSTRRCLLMRSVSGRIRWRSSKL